MLYVSRWRRTRSFPPSWSGAGLVGGRRRSLMVAGIRKRFFRSLPLPLNWLLCYQRKHRRPSFQIQFRRPRRCLRRRQNRYPNRDQWCCQNRRRRLWLKWRLNQNLNPNRYRQATSLRRPPALRFRRQ